MEGWQKISKLMDSGSSWSGNERNCAFLNIGQGQFVDISAAAGLDQVQDGRALASVDWDGDGDLDLWLKSRNGQQLRLLENNQKRTGNFVGLRLRGTTCNRDAIGARVVLSTADQSYSQELRAGEGYLSQSSSELIFGLPARVPLKSVLVHWPGGAAEAFEGVQQGQHQCLVQGSGIAVILDSRQVALQNDEVLPTLESNQRIVLRTPLPFPTSLQRKWFDSDKAGARLISLWATWCSPCIEELGELAEQSEELSAIGLDIIPLCLDASGNEQLAQRLFETNVTAKMSNLGAFQSSSLSDEERGFFEALYEHLIPKHGSMPLPFSLLIDRHGLIELIYLGPVDMDTLQADVATYGLEPQSVGVRSHYPGRWFYGMPRNLQGLSEIMKSKGHEAASSFYKALDAMAQRQQR